MRRRELLGALSLGGVGLSSGCLSRAIDATKCSTSSRFGVIILNHRFTPVELQVEIQTRLLGRDVFSETFDVPAAIRKSGRTYQPGIIYEPNIVSNLRSYDVSVNYRGKAHTYEWQVSCSNLQLRTSSSEEYVIGFVPTTWKTDID